MTAPLAVGDVIHGFANGAFGRDSYDCKKIEAVGRDWIVCRDDEGYVYLATGRTTLGLCQANRKPTTDINDDPCCGLDEGPPLTTWSHS